MSEWNALIIEDETDIRRFVRSMLEAEQWRVYEADTLRLGEKRIAEFSPELILLDLGLPDGDGVGLISRLRKTLNTPIIILSARNREEDKVRALDAGADDYLTKPFGLQEFLARIRVIKRRLHQSRIEATPTSFHFGNVDIDTEAHRVIKHGLEVHLTRIEYRILLALIEKPGRVMTHRELLRRVWGPAHSSQLYLVRIHMSNLRSKLEDDPSRPMYILTEAGVGYRLQQES